MAVVVNGADDWATAITVDSGSGPVHPALPEVLAGRYQPLSRPRFLYISIASLQSKPQLSAFLTTYLSSIRNWVHFTGYMPLSAQAYDRALKRLEARTAGTRFDGQLTVGIGIDELYD